MSYGACVGLLKFGLFIKDSSVKLSKNAIKSCFSWSVSLKPEINSLLTLGKKCATWGVIKLLITFEELPEGFDISKLYKYA
jgi:hypothetical protein